MRLEGRHLLCVLDHIPPEGKMRLGCAVGGLLRRGHLIDLHGGHGNLDHGLLNRNLDGHGTSVGVGHELLVGEHSHGRLLGFERMRVALRHSFKLLVLVHEVVLQRPNAFDAGGHGRLVGAGGVGRGWRERRVEFGIVDDGVFVANVFERGLRVRFHRRVRGRREAGAREDPVAEFREGDAMLRVLFKDPAEDGVQVIREGQDGLQELGVAGESPVGGVFNGGLLPGVASTGKIHQDDAQAPHIVGGGEVVRPPRRVVQALCFGISLLIRNVRERMMSDAYLDSCRKWIHIRSRRNGLTMLPGQSLQA